MGELKGSDPSHLWMNDYLYVVNQSRMQITNPSPTSDDTKSETFSLCASRYDTYFSVLVLSHFHRTDQHDCI